LLRADCSEEESQVGLVLPEDVRLSEAETMIIGGLNRERVGVLRAPPNCDFRSAPATPDGVCACLSRSFL